VCDLILIAAAIEIEPAVHDVGVIVAAWLSFWGSVFRHVT
jgi:hypothetical protein